MESMFLRLCISSILWIQTQKLNWILTLQPTSLRTNKIQQTRWPANRMPVSNNWDWWSRAASYLTLLCLCDKVSDNISVFSLDLFCIPGCIWVGLGLDPVTFERKGLQRFRAKGNWASALLEVCAAAGLTLFSSPWSSQLSTHPHQNRTDELCPGLGHVALSNTCLQASLGNVKTLQMLKLKLWNCRLRCKITMTPHKNLEGTPTGVVVSAKHLIHTLSVTFFANLWMHAHVPPCAEAHLSYQANTIAPRADP